MCNEFYGDTKKVNTVALTHVFDFYAKRQHSIRMGATDWLLEAVSININSLGEVFLRMFGV